MRVVYLSAHPYGYKMWCQLEDWHPKCELVFATTTDNKPDWPNIPEYDIGINFLGTHKIPADQIRNKNGQPRWLNFHPAPLPEYKGRNLAYQVIMDGAQKFGATLHYMDEEYDTGQLIEVQRFPIECGDTAGDLVRKSHECLKNLFMAYIPVVLSKGVLHSYPQADKGMYYKKSPINECIGLSAWQERRIRALTVAGKFYPHCVIGGRKYKIVLDEQ